MIWELHISKLHKNNKERKKTEGCSEGWVMLDFLIQIISVVLQNQKNGKKVGVTICREGQNEGDRAGTSEPDLLSERRLPPGAGLQQNAALNTQSRTHEKFN